MKKPLRHRIKYPEPSLKKGSSDTAGVPPFRGEPRIQCPITGMWMHVSEAKWDGDYWVHPKAWDAPGYKEPLRDAPRRPPLSRQPRSTRIRGRYELD